MKMKFVKSVGEVELKKLFDIAQSSDTAKSVFSTLASKLRNRGFFDVQRLSNEILLARKPLDETAYQNLIKQLESEGYGKVMGTRFMLSDGNGVKTLGTMGVTGKAEETPIVAAPTEKKSPGRPKGTRNKTVRSDKGKLRKAPEAAPVVPKEAPKYIPGHQTVIVVLGANRSVTMNLPQMTKEEADKLAEAIKAIPRAS